MRTEIFLSVTAIAAAFISGALVLTVKDGAPHEFSAPVLEREVQKFTNTVPAIDSFSSEYLSEQLSPENQLPTFYKYDLNEVDRLLTYAESCKAASVQIKNHSLLKAWQWHKAQCNHQKLPDSFFEVGPIIHPSGESYAKLSKGSAIWNSANIKLFHVSELEELGVESLPAPYNFLSQLPWQSLYSLARGEALVVTPNYVFLNEHDDKITYKVYSIDLWKRYWEKTPYQARLHKSGEACFVKQDSICWNYNFKQAFFNGWNPLVALLILTLALTVGTLGLLAMRFRKHRAQEHRLKFALEMLAHEIRTPVTNLSLHLEKFRNDFDVLPPQSQSTLLRFFDQVERLRRIVDASGNYLGKNLGHSTLEPKFSEVSSLKGFVEHSLDPYLERISVQITDNGRPIVTDPYWASICIKNVVENAIKHGAHPVVVRASQTQNSWSVEVEDQGITTFDPSQKHPKSTGLGLGLKIVKEIAVHLKAQVTFSFQPTKIKITFSEPA